jgi:hypothetical protein
VVPPFLWTYPDQEKLIAARRFEPLYGAIGINFGLESVGGNGPSLKRWKLLFVDRSVRLGQLAGVGALVLPADGTGMEIGRPRRLLVQRFAGLPRAIVVPQAIVVEPERAVAATLDERLDLRSIAVLEEGSPLRRDPRWRSQDASVRLSSRGPGRVDLTADLPGNGVLVVFNSFERGWQARVDGAPARVLPADGAFQAVCLSAGEHAVQLRYRPRKLALGLAIGVAGLLVVALVAARLRDEILLYPAGA